MRTHHLSVYAAWLILAVFSAAPSGALAQPSSSRNVDPAARSAFEAGRDAYDSGRFAEALEHFERAYALSPNPILLYNIGRAAEADLQYERAITSYERYLEALERAENREFVEARLAKLREMQSREASAPRVHGPSPVAPPPPPPGAAPGTEPTFAPARPSRAIPGFRVYGGLRAGFGGDMEAEYEDEDYEGPTLPADTTLGLQLGAGYVWRFFGIGGELRLNWSGSDLWEGRQMAIDVVAKPRAGYVFQRIPLELYGTIPIGVSIPLYDDLYDPQDDLTVEINPGVTVGVLAGVSYFFTEHLGANVEGGWMLHAYGFTDSDDDTGTLSFGQGVVNLNMMLAF